MNTNMVPPVQQQPNADGSTYGDNNNYLIGSIPKSKSSSAAAAAAADSLHENNNDVSTPVRSDDVIATTGPWDEEVGDPSPTPFDNGYDDNSLKPLSLSRQLFTADEMGSDDPTQQDLPEDDASESESLRIITIPSESDKRILPEDTFSFFVYSRVLPIPSSIFILATLVFAFQMAIYGVLVYDITASKTNNPLKLPVNVETPVRIAEFLAGAVAIITQDEVRTAVNLIRDGFDQDLLPKAFPGATKSKWIWSIMLRGIEGIFGLLLTCLLIMQSTTVLELLLNFLAMEFVSLLDDVVFLLTKEGFVGFLGQVLQNEAKKVSNTHYHMSHRSVEVRNASASFVKNAYFLVLCTGIFAGWVCIVWKQDNGKYLCSTIFAQYGDDQLPMLGTFSGLFYLQNKSFASFDRRLSYRDDRVGGALLAYCHEEKRWTLSLGLNPCNWTAASSESEDFDVLATANTQWVVKTSTSTVPLSQHFLSCHECKYDKKLCGNSGDCVRRSKNEQCRFGKCVGPSKYDQCNCSKGHYGLRCEYPEPCQRLEMGIGQPNIGIVKTGEIYFASKYYMLQGVEAYNHPVYASADIQALIQTLSNDTHDTDFFVFTGVRWIWSRKRLFPGLKDVNDKRGLVGYFSQFHGQFTSEFEASFVSEQVYIDTPADAKASPLSVRWRFSASDKDQRLQPDLQKRFIETSFFCSVCNSSTNPCQFEGVCLLNGTCGDCPNGSSGTMCQIPPTSNGKCNPYFNNMTFGFDGGDCCENTCRSTPENTCGKAGQGYIDTGYPSCTSASNQWELSGDQIDGVSTGSRSGHAVALSGKGAIIAVADPGVSIVRLFDKDGATWIERGQVQGPPESNFGLAIELSHESYNITRNPRTYPTVTLAVGAPKLGLVRVYTCSSNTIASSDRIGCIQRGKDINGGGWFGNSLSISKDGNSIAIGGADRESIVPEKNTSVAIGGADMDPTGENMVGDVKVFTWSNHTNGWLQKGNVTLATAWPDRSSALPYQFDLRGYHVSLSGDYLAVGTLKGRVTPMPRFESVNLTCQVYKWDESTGWNRLGDEIRKNFYDDASFGDPWPLKSVVIKGSILAIGSNSSVSVYEWNEASLKWNPREIGESEGSKSEVNELLGWSIDLSEDANILAVGESVENPQPTDESVRMYKWDGKRYKALSNGVHGGPAASVSLSSDGRAVAVGSPFDSSNKGATRVYSFYPSDPCEDPSQIPLRISFTTDGRPEETSWELWVDSEVKRSSGSLSGYMDTTFVEEMCVPATSCVKFIVHDTQGDGLNPPGVFALMLNGDVTRGDGDFRNETCIAKGIGDCECT